jgi:hypothetical protein
LSKFKVHLGGWFTLKESFVANLADGHGLIVSHPLPRKPNQSLDRTLAKVGGSQHRLL